jgi:hypothetical protein
MISLTFHSMADAYGAPLIQTLGVIGDVDDHELFFLIPI